MLKRVGLDSGRTFYKPDVKQSRYYDDVRRIKDVLQPLMEKDISLGKQRFTRALTKAIEDLGLAGVMGLQTNIHMQMIKNVKEMLQSIPRNPNKDQAMIRRILLSCITPTGIANLGLGRAYSRELGGSCRTYMAASGRRMSCLEMVSIQEARTYVLISPNTCTKGNQQCEIAIIQSITEED